MANTGRNDYDSSIGTGDRSAVSATKLWAIILGLIGVVGVVLLVTFFNNPTGGGASSGPVSSENTATRPAEP